MNLHQRELSINFAPEDALASIRESLSEELALTECPVRLAVTETKGSTLRCEVGVIESSDQQADGDTDDSILDLRRRGVENTHAFNAALVVPTGVGSAIGGHAGDATPVLRAMSALCDRVFTHPNVVNASDLNEMPENAEYVEGSVLARFLMGTAGLQPVRANRVLVIADENQNTEFVEGLINSVGAARAVLGTNVVRVVTLNPTLNMEALYSKSGAAVGRIESLERVFSVLDDHDGSFDAVALSTVVHVPFDYHMGYFQSAGDMVNPWGGVEALLTHAISERYRVPSAHSPMFESPEVSDLRPGIIDPRMAAEAVSYTFFHCVLKGLHRSPRIITAHEAMKSPAVYTAEDVSCLIIPDGCLGLPTLAALEQGIPVIAVRENRNILRNDLTVLPWKSGQLIQVENYWEAIGVMAALKSGTHPAALRRPLGDTQVERSLCSDARQRSIF